MKHNNLSDIPSCFDLKMKLYAKPDQMSSTSQETHFELHTPFQTKHIFHGKLIYVKELIYAKVSSFKT